MTTGHTKAAKPVIPSQTSCRNLHTTFPSTMAMQNNRIAAAKRTIDAMVRLAASCFLAGADFFLEVEVRLVAMTSSRFAYLERFSTTLQMMTKSPTAAQ